MGLEFRITGHAFNASGLPTFGNLGLHVLRLGEVTGPGSLAPLALSIIQPWQYCIKVSERSETVMCCMNLG